MPDVVIQTESQEIAPVVAVENAVDDAARILSLAESIADSRNDDEDVLRKLGEIHGDILRLFDYVEQKFSDLGDRITGLEITTEAAIDEIVDAAEAVEDEVVEAVQEIEQIPETVEVVEPPVENVKTRQRRWI